MSTLTADPGFARGEVLGVTKKYYSAENGDGSHMLGVHKVFRDVDVRAEGKVLSNETVECVAVKNTSGGALLPGTLVEFKAAAPLTEVATAGADASIRVGVVDEYLPAAGVPDDEVFWVVVKGPTKVDTDGSSTYTNGAAIQAAAGVGERGYAEPHSAGEKRGFVLTTTDGSAEAKVRVFVTGV